MGPLANLMLFGVLSVGTARALVVTAVAQGPVAVIGLCAGWFRGAILTAFFVAIWLTSAHLFRKAAREQGLPGPRRRATARSLR